MEGKYKKIQKKVLTDSSKPIPNGKKKRTDRFIKTQRRSTRNKLREKL